MWIAIFHLDSDITSLKKCHYCMYCYERKKDYHCDYNDNHKTYFHYMSIRICVCV